MHANSKNLVNIKYNNLTAIKPVPKPNDNISKRRGTYWLCKCDCGNEKVVMSKELLNGHTKSCGCMNKYENSHNYRGFKSLPQSIISKIKWGAVKRNLTFNVTIEYLWDLFEKQNGKCYYTKEEIILKPKNQKGITASLDRVNSNIGYEIGNVVWVHKDINKMKMEFPEDRFFYLCELVVNNLKNIKDS